MTALAANMKITSSSLRAICCGLVFLFVLVIGQEQKYTTKYDNVDIDALLNNERLLNGYVACLLDANPCSPDAAELKSNLPDALATECSSCSEAQKILSDRLSHHLIDHRPNDWALLEQKYDPTGDYRKRYLHSQETDQLEKSESSSLPDKDE